MLFLTDEGSPTVESVGSMVEALGCEILVVSKRDLPAAGRVSISADAVAFGYGPASAEMRDCRGVWLWHAERPSAADADAQVARYVEGEWELAVSALASVVDPRRWINHPRAAHWWECNKIAQLELAQGSGMLVPTTLLSNDPATILEFAARFEQVAVKAQAAVRLDTPDGFATTFTQLCSADELAGNAPGLSRAPLVVQPYLEKRVEIRATVIDDKVSLCEIDSQASDRTRVDWRRYDFDRVAHTLIRNPDLEQQLANLVATAGLRYAAIDLLETPAGETYFLDLNPSGQFHWIEGLTGAPLARSLAQSLVGAAVSPPL